MTPRECPENSRDTSEVTNDELKNDLAGALNGVLQRELRGVDAVEEPSSESDLVHTRRFPAAVVAFESVFQVLLRAAGALEVPRYERYGWHFHFMVGNQRAGLRWTKRGINLDLYGPILSQRNPDVVASDIERRLVAGAKQIYRRVITPRLSSRIRSGDVTVINQYRRYRGMVDFYLQQMEHPISGPVVSHEEQAGNSIEDVMAEALRAAFAPFRIAEERAHRATALVAGYFSWVQHLLITLSAFSPKALEPDFSVEVLLSASWAEQFDQAYPRPHDHATTQLKSHLSSLAREFRNPLLHGGGGRYEDGLVVEWAPGQHIMALDPDAATDLYMLWQPSLSTEQVDDLVARIALIDQALQAHPFFEWVASGAPANFEPDRIRRALRAVENGTTNDFIRLHSEAYDNQINWDY